MTFPVAMPSDVNGAVPECAALSSLRSPLPLYQPLRARVTVTNAAALSTVFTSPVFETDDSVPADVCDSDCALPAKLRYPSGMARQVGVRVICCLVD
jgi:hypothetical protein